MPTNILFLFTLADINQLRVYFDNTQNILVQDKKKKVPVIYKYSYLFILLNSIEQTIVYSSEIIDSYLTKFEL